MKQWCPDVARRFPTYQAAIDRIEELEGMRDEQGRPMPKRVLGLSPLRTRLVQAIACRGFISRERLILMVWGGDVDRLDIHNLISSHISFARRGLSRHGIEIRTEWGEGFFMPADSRKRWQDAARAASERVPA
jgi:DNA-binding response OmpR family regulator